MKLSQKIYLPFKYLIDAIGSFVGIVVCFLLLWWWILIVNTIVIRGNPVFASKRVGKNNKTFKCFKFRSMRKCANPNMASCESDSKDLVTKFGKFLRKTSLDETLQLINILIGQMSFIGPRPLINNSDDAVTIMIRSENGANLIRPGMSGYAQVHGRTKITAKEKGDLDGYYYKNFSFLLDIKIFFQTFFGVCDKGE